MRFHRAISVLTLAAFLPLAAGCSTQTTRQLHSDPGDERAASADDWLAEERVPIAGYTLQDGRFHEWDGTVQALGADSLLFVRSISDAQWGSRRSPDTLEARHLNRQDVASIVERREDVLVSSYAVWAVSIGLMVLVATVLGATRGDTDES